MKKVCIIGHFGNGKKLLNGQTVKTKIITDELICSFGNDQVVMIDTHGGAKALPRCILNIIREIKICENIVIMPAQNGLKILAPLISIINKIYHRKLHYIVVGGWLPDFILNHQNVSRVLKKFDAIYVETNAMLQNLSKSGFKNVLVIPNCKPLKILKESELVYSSLKPYKLCTFSRVMKEKGVEDAVIAVKNINERFGCIVFELDIYGQVELSQIEWFNHLLETFPSYIKYRDAIDFEKSTDVLKNYYALLFPTFYEGEGFAGTLIDAFAAGVPVVCSDWKYNCEIVNSKVGEIHKHNDTDDLERVLSRIANENQTWNLKKKNCLNRAIEYLPSNALKVFISRL